MASFSALLREPTQPRRAYTRSRTFGQGQGPIVNPRQVPRVPQGGVRRPPIDSVIHGPYPPTGGAMAPPSGARLLPMPHAQWPGLGGGFSSRTQGLARDLAARQAQLSSELRQGGPTSQLGQRRLHLQNAIQALAPLAAQHPQARLALGAVATAADSESPHRLIGY